MAGKSPKNVLEICQAQILAKHQDLEKHASAHARSMAVTLERIEDTEQNIKIVRKKICNNEEEISKMSKENNDILYPREKDLVRTLSALQKEKETMEKEGDKKSIQLNSEIQELQEKLYQILQASKVLEGIKLMEQDEGSQSEPAEGSTSVPENEQSELLNYLQESLQEKEKELECPVCLETAEVPIFMCHESHLVCNTCLPKLKTCPECREKMPNPSKRHRYAEKQLEEAKKVQHKIDSILKDVTTKDHNQKTLSSSNININRKEENAGVGMESVEELTTSFYSIRNIPQNVSVEDIFAEFSRYGTVKNISISDQTKNQKKKKKDKSATVRFENSAHPRILYEGIILGNKEVSVKPIQEATKINNTNILQPQNHQREEPTESHTIAPQSSSSSRPSKRIPIVDPVTFREVTPDKTVAASPTSGQWITCSMKIPAIMGDENKLQYIHLICPENPQNGFSLDTVYYYDFVSKSQMKDLMCELEHPLCCMPINFAEKHFIASKFMVDTICSVGRESATVPNECYSVYISGVKTELNCVKMSKLSLSGCGGVNGSREVPYENILNPKPEQLLWIEIALYDGHWHFRGQKLTAGAEITVQIDRGFTQLALKGFIQLPLPFKTLSLMKAPMLSICDIKDDDELLPVIPVSKCPEVNEPELYRRCKTEVGRERLRLLQQLGAIDGGLHGQKFEELEVNSPTCAVVNIPDPSGATIVGLVTRKITKI